MGLAAAISATIGGDTAPLQAAGQRVEQITAKINGVLGTIGVSLSGAAAIGAFVSLGKGAIELAGRLSDTATNIGINVEQLQALEAQAKRNGVSEEMLTKALEKVRAAGIDAFNGNEKQTAALGALGIRAEYFIRLPLAKQYSTIATAVAFAADRNVAYNAAADIFGGKIGPKLQATLIELGTKGLPLVTQEARKLGQVMSAETIAALDNAGDAIDDFKKKITVSFGSFLINFRSEEGLKLMGYQLLSVATGFGGKLLDALAQANDFLVAVFTGSLRGVANNFRDVLIEGIKNIAQLMNTVLPKKFEINVAGLDRFKSSGEGIVQSVVRAIGETKPTTFAKDFAAFYDKLAAEQQKVVDNLNRVDFAKPAGDLRKAGNDFTNSGNKAADALKEGAKAIDEAAAALAAKAAKAAAEFGGIFKTVGRDDSELTDRELKNKIAALQQNVFARQTSLNGQVGGVGSGGTGLYDPFLGIENRNLQGALAQLGVRQKVARDVSAFGEEVAFKNSGLTEQKFAEILRTATDSSTVVAELKELNRSLRTGTARVGAISID